jgi:hypothetical protein
MTTLAVSFAVVAVGCSSDADDVKAGPGQTPHAPADELAAAFGPAIAGLDGGRAVIWGGLSVSDPTGPNLASGRIVSLESGEETVLPEAPFEVPVASPRAAANGDRVLVVGQSCPEWEDRDFGRECQPGAFIGAVFDVASEAWTPLAGGDDLAGSLSGVVTLDSWGNVALISSAAQPEILATVDLVKAETVVLPEPPIADGDSEHPTTVTTCITDSDVLLAERTAPPGFNAEAQDGPAARIHAYSLEDGAWRTLNEPPGIWDPVMTCAEGGALLSNGAGVSSGSTWLDLEEDSWREVQPPTGSPAPYSVRVGTEGGVLLFDGTASGPGLRFDADARTFAAVDGEPEPFDCDWGQCIGTSGEYVLGAMRTSDAPAETKLFWFQP